MAMPKFEKNERGKMLDISLMGKIPIELNHGIFKVLSNGVTLNLRGIGAFYEAYDKHLIKHSLFITSHKIISTSSRSELLKVTFESDAFPQLNQLYLNKWQILHCWTDPTLGATIIELTRLGERFFLDNGVEFIKIGLPKLNDVIKILQFTTEKFKFANGTVLDISNSMIKYHIGTGRGTSGSPILNSNCEALGIFYEEEKSNGLNEHVQITQLSQLDQTAFTLCHVLMVYFDDFNER